MTFNKHTTCCFTGHRSIPSYLYSTVRQTTSEQIEKLIRQGYDTFISGAAIGFDLIAAEAVINLKMNYPSIRLIFAIPCPDHDAKWSYSERIRLNVLMRYCDATVQISDSYYDGCMLKRNRYMIDNSSHCISYCTKKVGGTAYTLRYASANEVPCTEISSLLY